MDRTTFLKSFLAKGLLLTSALTAKAIPSNLKSVLIYKHYVAGFQYGEGLKLIDHMKVSDELDLVLEPENEHDNKAIAIYWKQYKVGYVPAIDNEMPNNILNNGLVLKSYIEKLEKEAEPWNMCEAGIYLLYPKDLIQNTK